MRIWHILENTQDSTTFKAYIDMLISAFPQRRPTW